MIKEKAYAKINLALEVMNVKDGYHMVNNLMIPIDIYDEITFEKSDKIELINNPFPDNIILKAANMFIEKYNIKSGVKMELIKNIPSAAGLAGGSSDGAATLRGLNKLFDNVAAKEELLNMAASLGSDVPFFIDMKLALCTGRGEIINPCNISYKSFDILLIKPQSGLSTKEVYKAYKCDGISKTFKIDNIVSALQYCDIFSLKQNIFNDLTNVALSLNNELRDIYNDLKERTDIYLSGSGPTMFIINPTEEIIDYVNKNYKNCFIRKCQIL